MLEEQIRRTMPYILRTKFSFVILWRILCNRECLSITVQHYTVPSSIAWYNISGNGPAGLQQLKWDSFPILIHLSQDSTPIWKVLRCFEIPIFVQLTVNLAACSFKIAIWATLSLNFFMNHLNQPIFKDFWNYKLWISGSSPTSDWIKLIVK